MSIYGYEIKTSFDFFRKLLDEREDFLKDPSSSRYAINCALTGWHLHEWVFEEYKNSLAINGFDTLTEFRKFLFKNCWALRTFKDLSNGSKHFSITRDPSSILNTEVRKAGSSLGFTTILTSPTLIVDTNYLGVGTIITFDDLLYLVTYFWYGYFINELKVEANNIITNYSPF